MKRNQFCTFNFIFVRQFQFKAILLWAILSLIHQPVTAARQSAWLNPPDTIAIDDESSELLYEIEFMRLAKRLAAGNFEPGKNPDIDLVLQFKKDAEEAAARGNYVLAQITLEEANGLLTGIQIPEEALDQSAPVFEGTETERTVHVPECRREILFGTDAWRHEFEMTTTDSDTTLLEGEQNPFYGILLGFDFMTQGNTQFRGKTSLKNSRDYLVADAELSARTTFNRSSTFEFDNKLEWTEYHADNLKYFHDAFALRTKSRIGAQTDFNVRTELSFRNYAQEDEFYASYFQGKLFGSIDRNIFSSHRIGLGYEFLSRMHATADEKNYRDHRLDATWSMSAGYKMRLFVNNQMRLRDYVRAESDSTYQNDYFDEYLLANLTLSLTDDFSLQLENNLNYREYRHQNPIMPTYFQNDVKPSLLYRFNQEVTFNFGYFYGFAAYAEQTAETASFVSNEDYNTNGPALGIEIFHLTKFMMSCSYSYEMRRYPNSQTRDITSFSLFSDRNIHSLLLFLLWELTDDISVSLIANYDNDKDKQQEHSDSRSTMLSIEFNYQL
ncbi:hypothetical protein JXJ21_17245 [candidate division KSB1 bacterium]|nr:hypothetical protein [candidate division KSB1 bacterium]